MIPRTLQADQTNISDLRSSADIIEEVSDTVTYLGFCQPGTVLTSENRWSILKIEQSGNVQPILTTFKWADGLCCYSKSWNARAGYNYSFRNF